MRPVESKTLTNDVRTRLTFEDAMCLHHLARIQGCTEEQMARYALRKFIVAAKDTLRDVVPDLGKVGGGL